MAVIFVTVGTTHFPFDRLIRAVAALPRDEEELVVQRGASTVEVPGATVVEFLPLAEVERLVRSARVVISHAGVGSIMVVLAGGRQPIVVPRLARYGETVDDHQREIASRLAARSWVVAVEDVSHLASTVASRAYEPRPKYIERGALIDVVAEEAARAFARSTGGRE